MRKTIPILMYHSVDNEFAPAYSRWVVTPSKFTEHLRVLRDQGCTPVTVSQLADQRRKGKPVAKGTVAITFDDGLADFLLNALPILEDFEFASTLYVATGYVGETSRWLSDLGEGNRPMMSWSDIATLPSRNVELGAHTHSHPQMDLISKHRARTEIELSKFILEEQTGQNIRTFAYPHGYSTIAVRKLIAHAGFTSACRVGNALSTLDETPLALSRIVMTQDTTPVMLERYINGFDLPVSPNLVRVTAMGWRMVRKMRSLSSAHPQVVGNSKLDMTDLGHRKSGAQ